MNSNSIFTTIIYLIIFIPLLWSCSREEEPEVNIRLVMLNEVNKVRSGGCLCGTTFMPPAAALSWNDTLEAAALLHARDMVQNSYFSHISPEGSSPIQRATEAGYSGNYVGENIARGYSNVQQVIQAWLQSEDHCKALMDTLYVEMGVARYQNYWVQKLGSLR